METIQQLADALGLSPHQTGWVLVLGLFVLMLGYYIFVEWLVKTLFGREQ